MPASTRRNFLQASGAAIAAGSLATGAARATVTRARPVVGFIGCGGRAQSLFGGFAEDATVAWACDPDEKRAKLFAEKSGAIRSTSDLREVLRDDAVDAVVIATPDHWHAPAAIMACEAGKHVYVEKPCSHNLREGRLLVEAAKRNSVVVQHGTQSRNDPRIAGAVQMLREGLIGDVLMAKAWNVQRRRNIGHSQPSDPPAGLDYDTWVGPAEFVPFQDNRFHYDWHWWHNFGTGDIGNDGTHEIDMARWGLGVSGLPSTVTALGGKYYFDDDQQFPDTATCTFEWPGDGGVGRRKQLIFEMRIWSTNYPHNCDSGIEFYGTKGMLFVSKRGKLQVWDESNRPVSDPSPREKPQLPKNHQFDFLQAIIDGRTPAADAETAHDSTALVHLANVAVRVGRSLSIDVANETVVGDAEADALLGRTYRDGGHWSVPSTVIR
ncbi:MAG: Gfo/Idh/MocA family oxidoreductase [Planctomycetaceae bacterium]